MLVRFQPLLLLLAIALLASGCRPPTNPTTVSASDAITVQIFADASPVVGPSVITVEVQRNGTPLDGADVEVTGDMTHAGMVPVIATAHGVGNGRYETRTFAFDMAGDWILTADVKLGRGERVTADLARTVLRP